MLGELLSDMRRRDPLLPTVRRRVFMPDGTVIFCSAEGHGIGLMNTEDYLALRWRMANDEGS